MNKNIIAAVAGVAGGVAIFFTREKIKALRAADKLEEDVLKLVETIEEPEPGHDEEVVVHKPVDDVIDRKVEAVTEDPGWTYPDEETYLEHEDLPEKNLFWFVNDDMIIDDDDLPITDYVESLIGDLCEVAKQNGDRGFCINNKEGLRFSMEIITEPIGAYMCKMREDPDDFDEDDFDEDEDE